jgi:outer membrane protein assembly factor BamD
MRRILLKQICTIWLALLTASLLGGCFGRKDTAPVPGASAEPDKVLYTKAVDDLKHHRYEVGRLALQTLINTYPDSEYLAKAKLAIGDSYFKEGGGSGLKQSILEYKDFITFFPFLDEAAYAQLQIGMAHYLQMEKPDRDHTEAVEAEAEFQTFVEKYPKSPLLPQAEQRLREVQEVLAEGNFRVAQFYYIRGAYRAAGDRLLELTKRYPLYSRADQANWMLGQIYEKIEHNEIAARYYSQIVKDYPLSPLAGDAKARLTKFGVPIPPADPAALARMQEEQAAGGHPGFLRRSLGIFSSHPDVSMASRSGEPTMTPASESGDETVTLGPRPTMTVGVAGGPGNSATVETVTPGSQSSVSQPAASTPDPAPIPSNATANAGGSAAAAVVNTNTPAPPADKSKESTSKKKKGIHRILPF